jgi:hypothetical protein
MNVIGCQNLFCCCDRITPILKFDAFVLTLNFPSSLGNTNTDLLMIAVLISSNAFCCFSSHFHSLSFPFSWFSGAAMMLKFLMNHQ